MAWGQVVQVQQAGLEAVIDVVGVVGDLVGQVSKLRLESRLTTLEESLAQVTECPGISLRAMLQDALARLEAEVETGEGRVFLFEFVHDAQ